LQDFLGRLPSDEGLYHRPRCFPGEIADHDGKPDAAVRQHLVQTILLGGQLSNQALPLPGNQTQLAQIRRRHERPTQQTRARQGRQPFEQGAGRDLLLMHVQTNHSLM
jgi:hypothetical protein